MREFLSKYNMENEEKLNIGIMKREFDEPLVNYLVDAAKSMEVLSNIKFVGYEYTEDPLKIDMNNFIQTRSTSRADQEALYEYISVNRTAQLTLKFKLSCLNKKTLEFEECDISKKMLIPIVDDNGYFNLRSKKFILLYQLVDRATYVTKDSVVLKSFLPIKVKKNYTTIKNKDGEEFDTAIFTILMFNKDRNILPFFLAKYGMTKTLEFFGVEDCISFVDKHIPCDEVYMYFTISSKLYLKVRRYIFNKSSILTSIVTMILDSTNTKTTKMVLDDKSYWLHRLGVLTSSSSSNNVIDYVGRGITISVFLTRMLDITTQKNLNLHPENKESIYHVLRFLMTEYSNLRKKNNNDMLNKRLRYNSFIAALFTQVLSDRLNRVINKGNRLDMATLKDIFSFQGSILTSLLHKSGLLRFDDIINDMSFWNWYRYSVKGNSGQSSSGKTITKNQRKLNPSLLGCIDLTAIGSSDPGTSGIITPMTKMKSLDFSDSYEPESERIKFDMLVNKMLEEDGYYVVHAYNDEHDYFTQDDRFNVVMDGIKIKKTKDEQEYYDEVIILSDREHQFSLDITERKNKRK